ESAGFAPVPGPQANETVKEEAVVDARSAFVQEAQGAFLLRSRGQQENALAVGVQRRLDRAPLRGRMAIHPRYQELLGMRGAGADVQHREAEPKRFLHDLRRS